MVDSLHAARNGRCSSNLLVVLLYSQHLRQCRLLLLPMLPSLLQKKEAWRRKAIQQRVHAFRVLTGILVESHMGSEAESKQASFGIRFSHNGNQTSNSSAKLVRITNISERCSHDG